MAESINFRYESVENMIHLLCDIQFEKTSTVREIAVYHELFDGKDEIFGQFALEVFPEGKTLDVPDITLLVYHIKRYMNKDITSRKLLAEYDMAHNSSYVYFKPDERVIPCYLASHSRVVRDILCDYFKGFDEKDLTEEYLTSFIKENFKIKSDFTTPEQVAKDWAFLARCIILQKPSYED